VRISILWVLALSATVEGAGAARSGFLSEAGIEPTVLARDGFTLSWEA
jgi:hypothetical protein